ncbi:MAG: DUF5615 family PIN-like protein [Candidatus Omnitrophica bacterium]|nr:DUF5615 family PIN-like protein [Candidatus Omnitrophota bacterium]MBU1809855.1 DUF5615 family PIN-like protein [Candidatus Omnitrophota bacterium]
MDFVVDENVPAELTSWLKKIGHNVFSPLKGTPDEKVALLSKERKAILLTQDRHFTNTLRFPPSNFSGMVRIKIHPSYIEDITLSLEKLLKVFSQPEGFKGKLIILGKEGFFRLKE